MMGKRLKSGYKKWYRQTIIGMMARRAWLIDTFYNSFWKPKPGLESLLDTFSKHNKGLTFIQIGANDGYTHDPIAKFIYRDRWKGVLVEPQRKPFEQSLQVLYGQNDQVFPINAAISREQGKAVLYVIGFSEERWATGLASFRKESLQEHVDNGYVARCANKEGVKLPTNPEEFIKAQEVDCVTFDYLMSKHGLSHIDLLQIDAEGFDFEVIKMLDFDRIKPRLISFESYNLSDQDKAACMALLLAQGYALQSFGRDTVALASQESQKPAYAQWFG